MEKIGYWGIMLCRGKWFGISCLMGKKRKRGGRPFFMAVKFMTVRFYGCQILWP